MASHTNDLQGSPDEDSDNDDMDFQPDNESDSEEMAPRAFLEHLIRALDPDDEELMESMDRPSLLCPSLARLICDFQISRSPSRKADMAEKKRRRRRSKTMMMMTTTTTTRIMKGMRRTLNQAQLGLAANAPGCFTSALRHDVVKSGRVSKWTPPR